MHEIYVSHSTNFDYKEELYKPLDELFKKIDVKVIFPHGNDEFINTKEIIKNSSLIIAEVSFPSTGQGIELGWANSFGKDIVCFYKQGFNPSNSIKEISQNIFEYQNSYDLVIQIENIFIKRSY